MSEPKRPERDHHCTDCPGRPDFQAKKILEMHRGQCHQLTTTTVDHKKQEHTMTRGKDGYFRCPTCGDRCRIANVMRPHVNNCYSSKSNSRPPINTYDYSMPPDDPKCAYPRHGSSKGWGRVTNESAAAPRETRPRRGPVVVDNERGAEERYRALQAKQMAEAEEEKDVAQKEAGGSGSATRTAAKQAPAVPVAKLSLNFKKKPPAAAVKTESPAPSKEPGAPRRLHNPVSSVASGSGSSLQHQPSSRAQAGGLNPFSQSASASSSRATPARQTALNDDRPQARPDPLPPARAPYVRPTDPRKAAAAAREQGAAKRTREAEEDDDGDDERTGLDGKAMKRQPDLEVWLE